MVERASTLPPLPLVGWMPTAPAICRHRPREGAAGRRIVCDGVEAPRRESLHAASPGSWWDRCPRLRLSAATGHGKGQQGEGSCAMGLRLHGKRVVKIKHRLHTALPIIHLQSPVAEIIGEDRRQPLNRGWEKQYLFCSALLLAILFHAFNVGDLPCSGIVGNFR